eukprot:c6124_g1_i1 orf=737-2071(+)
MGTVALKLGADGSLRAARDSALSSIFKFLLAASIVGTNILTLYNLSASRDLERNMVNIGSVYHSNPARMLEEVAGIREELRLARRHLLEIHSELDSIRMSYTNSQKDEALLNRIASVVRFADQGISPELRISVSAHRLPLGKHWLFGTTQLVPAVGHACANNLDALEFYMNYTVGELCPDDWHIAQRLMLRGCEPLPRRRCFARSPPKLVHPSHFPQSLWSSPADDSIRWTHYTCKSLDCLNKRKLNKTFEDCIDCFDLEGIERRRWVTVRDRHDFIIDQVLDLKNGTIRVGLDIGGGSGSFAARMAERNVTIITTTLNLNGPFNEFIALRGLLPLYITIGQRLPFFDNTLDLVHSMHVLSNWIPNESLEFLLYDIDRVLRTGGIFWLDRFFCTEEQLQSLYIPMIQTLGYRRLKWVIGSKSDKNGRENRHVYLSALLEKPVRS